MPLSVNDITNDLAQWLNNQQQTINVVATMNGGWEQWCVIQFLLFQAGHRPALDYDREYNAGNQFIDVAYNRYTADAQHPVVLTEWKVGHDAVVLATDFISDITKLAGIKDLAAALVIAVSNQALAFPPGMMATIAVPGSAVRIYHTAPQAWQQFGGYHG